MLSQLVTLVLEAIFFYLLILWGHSLRHRYGHAHFYALLGGITAIMSWITDAGVQVHALGITLVIGSTVFYTSLLLGIFVVYVFDGPQITRIAISTVAGISVLVPAVAFVLHFQMGATGNGAISFVPTPDWRINTASVVATLLDMFFLAVTWEFFGKSNLGKRLWLRTWLTLLGVMWLDVLLFATGAFAGSPTYLNIMAGTLVDRFVISIFALPFLYFYLKWQNARSGNQIANRPVLAILMKVAEIEAELSQARQQIEKLSTLLKICSICKRFRDDQGDWQPIEAYIVKHSETELTHGICPECARRHYPDFEIFR